MFVAHNPNPNMGGCGREKSDLEMMTRERSTQAIGCLRKNQGLSHGMLRIQKQNGGKPMTCLITVIEGR